MSDIFNLFDGKMGAGGAASVVNQTQDSFSDVDEENDLIARLSSGSDSVKLLVDYSDFANFVTFNSAESYVTITADQILNEYPDGGSQDELQAFLSSLDGFQEYFLERWPAYTGHLRVTPAVSSSYIKVDDVGVENGISRSSFASPGTASFAVQGWLDVPSMTGSNDVMVIFQKSRGADGYTVFTSGSRVFGTVVSGSTTVTVSGTFTQMPAFFSLSFDRPASLLSMAVATTGTFPAVSDSASLSISGRFDLASGSFYMGSGSVPSKIVRPFTGSMDDVSLWSVARPLTALTSSFNRKVFAQSGLVGAWRFNEGSAALPRGSAEIVRDSSGHRLDGRIQAYYPNIRGSGSLAFDYPDPILNLAEPSVVSYIVDAQVSGALYDKNNGSMIFNMFPAAFSNGDPASAEVFKNFSLIMARNFDRVKTYISQLPNLRRVRYGEFDQAPDDLLGEVGKVFGWELNSSFIDTDALRYFLGRDVSAGPSGNAGLDIKLNEIKSSFWRRALLNLLYLYKTKGTRESIEAVLRTYGANNGFIRLKEYARKLRAGLPTTRIESEKSVNALTFGSGGLATQVVPALAAAPTGTLFSFEMRTKFPTSANTDLPVTQLSGELVTVTDVSNGTLFSLWYEKPSLSSTTGNLFLTSSGGALTLASLPLFDDDFFNISVVKERLTGSISLTATKYLDGEVTYQTGTMSLSGSAGYPIDRVLKTFKLGSAARASKPELWMNEFRYWNGPLTVDEMTAHAMHFESYGRGHSYDNSQLLVHWRLGDGTSASAAGTVNVVDSTLSTVTGSVNGVLASTSPFKKFLEGFSYLPSIDYGWNQEKVRIYEGSTIDPLDRYKDERFIALELNMYDALNEDISHLMSSYDEIGNFIGLPVNRYREDYEGLSQMRETYFKRLQSKLNFRVFVDMLDFFDTSFVSIVEKLVPARALFKGDEMVVESHMLERPKYQYQLRPIVEGFIDVSGTISVVDRSEDRYY